MLDAIAYKATRLGLRDLLLRSLRLQGKAEKRYRIRLYSWMKPGSKPIINKYLDDMVMRPHVLCKV